MNAFNLELVAIIVLSMSLWHATNGGPAPRVTRLQIVHHSCNGRNPVFYYIQMGYATQTTKVWDSSNASRDCTWVYRYLTSGRIITGWISKCENKNICSTTLKIRNGRYWDRLFKNCCN
ncbi:Hypothetical predicted protein [Mytilus galloprovincialis]|uniref:Uncharacterized protein n=2 Tax=Mytilus galloprovincialis TaxID=29158 RepID=A0A8B6FBW4_MYTGA|nr:Hypothetical predicted protein [Mytilus galloprovincialis]